MAAIAEGTLNERLAEALPKDCCFQIHHLSSPPTPCPAIYAAPPGGKQEKTFCESHFISVSIDVNGQQLQVFALEVLLYTTENLTTLFVSKADSTGYLHLLNLPNGTPSPLKKISTTFLAYLAEKRQRSHRRLVLSLFARAQDQYLFPGSIENSGKHVLDDRGLVRWWCRVVDPILRSHPGENNISGGEVYSASGNDLDTCNGTVHKMSAKGYLRVPGCDLFETRSFFPDRSKEHVVHNPRWEMGDPLRNLGRSPHWPERCLIPRFPDDPKARYVDKLDDELPEPAPQTQDSPSKGKRPGQWKSVQSLEQFWEMMSFRQECSSGRLVGFIWGVFTPAQETLNEEHESLESSLAVLRDQTTKRTRPITASSQAQDSALIRPESPTRSNPTPGLPLPSPSSSSVSSGKEKREPRMVKVQPEKTRYYYWPASTRGEVVLREKDYQRVNNLMLHLDYARKDIAAESTKRWINDISVMAGKSWGQNVVGKGEAKVVSHVAAEPDATVLKAGLVRKKKREDKDVDGKTPPVALRNDQNGVNVLSIGVVRKKPKIASDFCS